LPPPVALERERQRHKRQHQRALLLRQPRNHRAGASTGPAAEAGDEKNDIGALYHLDKAQMGLIATFGFWTYGLSVMINGPLADRIGGRKAILIGSLGAATLNLAVGLMFFNPAPQKFFPQTQIDVVQFPEGPGADTFTEKTVLGPLDVMLKDALAHLRNAVIEERVVKHGDRA
jgi:hypothetical protein